MIPTIIYRNETEKVVLALHNDSLNCFAVVVGLAGHRSDQLRTITPYGLVRRSKEAKRMHDHV
jgi:hypothetical protein